MKNRTAKRLRGWKVGEMPALRGCKGKKRYADPGSAHHALREMNSYQCEHCLGWHLGHAFFDPESPKE